MPLGQARDRFSEVLDDVERTHARVTVTRHGHPVAVIISPADLEALEETLALLATPGALAEVRDGINQADQGDTDSWDELGDVFGRSKSS